MHKKFRLLVLLPLMLACAWFNNIPGANQVNPNSALVGTIVAKTLTAYANPGLQSSPTPAEVQTMVAKTLTAYANPSPQSSPTPAGVQTQAADPTAALEIPEYKPGDLVDYAVQSGDSLPALAAHFNTTALGIRVANPRIAADATTLQPGMLIKIPIYSKPPLGPRIQIMPDSMYVNGPSASGFDTRAFVAGHPGWLKDYQEAIGGIYRSGAELVNIVATNFSLSPRALLVLLEYQAGALSQSEPPPGNYPLGHVAENAAGLYLQLVWAANILNDGYYGWRSGSLTQLVHPDGSIEHPDPWQNAATVAFQNYYSTSSRDGYARATGMDGLRRVTWDLFGDPWAANMNLAHIPADLRQPALVLPFAPGNDWYFTGGPHSGWGAPALRPWAGIDFAPHAPNCAISPFPAVAVADGVVSRSEAGVVMLDLDGDGNERTGWDFLYLHIAAEGEALLGRRLVQGEPLGFPSCEGGETTGTHMHIARKYNGEWIPIDGVIPFTMEGWIAHTGEAFYKGTLTRGDRTVFASPTGNSISRIRAGE